MNYLLGLLAIIALLIAIQIIRKGKVITHLIQYKYIHTHLFGDSWEYMYELSFYETHICLCGLYKWNKQYKITYIIDMFSSLSDHHDLWDRYIKEKTNICMK